MPDTHTIRSAEFTASRAWGALDIANMNGTTVRLHWTDQSPTNGTSTTARKCLP